MENEDTYHACYTATTKQMRWLLPPIMKWPVRYNKCMTDKRKKGGDYRKGCLGLIYGRKESVIHGSAQPTRELT